MRGVGYREGKDVTCGDRVWGRELRRREMRSELQELGVTKIDGRFKAMLVRTIWTAIM